MLSVLAYSKSFRTACREVEESVWNQLMESIGQNYVSLELFFKVRGLDWMTPLNQLGNSFSPDTVVSYVEQQKPRELPAEMFQKPHSYVVPNCDGLLHRPNYQGRLQMDIPSSTHDSQVFRQDPSLRGPHTGNCNFCGRQSCNCEPFSSENVSRPLAELIHCSAQKGVGVRSLQTIKKDDILDEYVGELKPANYVDDPTYALELEQLSNGMQIDNPTLIDAQVYGNWTRYINASCHPSLKFVPAAVGKRHRMLVVATRDIDVFEELTIGYGDGYWLESDTRMCECNEPNCRYADLDSKDKVKMMVDVPNNGMDIDEDDERMDEDL